jgi:hypothetical protein
MAALELAQKNSPTGNSSANTQAGANAGGDMAAMDMSLPMTPHPTEVSFPYGFPKAGEYRLFVQMKRGGTIETGVFDTQVLP